VLPRRQLNLTPHFHLKRLPCSGAFRQRDQPIHLINASLTFFNQLSGATRCPLYPQKRTSQITVVMSALCQKQTFCAAEKSRYSITSSAIETNPGGTVSPSAFAVLKFMTKSNLVGCSTGKSPGFSPLRMRPT